MHSDPPLHVNVAAKPRAARLTCSGICRAGVCAATLLLMIGCQAHRTGKPLASELAGNDPDAQINFWHALADEPVTSNDAAFHGLLLFADGKDNSTEYAGRVAALRARRWLPRDFNEPPDAAVKRGTVAVAIMRLLNQRGGVTTTILGPVPRYAVRELMFLNVYPPSTPNQSFSGTEFVGIIGAVEDFQRGHADNPAAQFEPTGGAVPPPTPTRSASVP